MTRYLGLCIFALITLWFVIRVLLPAGSQLTHGFAAYYAAAKLLTNGNLSEAIYDPTYFRPIVEANSHYQASDIYNANPPTTSLLFVPLSFFSIETARVIWTITNALLLWGGVQLLVHTFAPTVPPGAGLIVLSIAMLFQPAIENIRQGQAYLLIFMLLTIVTILWPSHNYTTTSTKKSVGSRTIFSIALASALLLKTGGAVLLPLLAWQRRWHYLLATVLTCVIIMLLTLPLFRPIMWRDYVRLLQEVTTSPQVCSNAYQTTRSLLCQLFVFDPIWSPQPLLHSPWLARAIFWGLALLTLILSLRIGFQSPFGAILSMITWGVIFAPIGEAYHHTVILIPLLWLLLKPQKNQTWFNLNNLILAGVIFLYIIPWSFGSWLSQSSGWMIVAYPRLIAAWLVWLALLRKVAQDRYSQYPNLR